MTEFRDLCARFVDEVDHLCRHGEQAPGHRLILTVDIEALEELRDETRAALCAEQKLGELGDEELWTIWNENDGPIPMILRAAIAADRARAALAEPEPEGPTDEELSNLWSWSAGQDQGPWPTQQHCFARAVLARWGNHPGSPDSSTPQPVPVSKRLPEPEDCDAEGRCWTWAIGTWRLSRINRSFHTHWLPSHALPQPS